MGWLNDSKKETIKGIVLTKGDGYYLVYIKNQINDIRLYTSNKLTPGQHIDLSLDLTTNKYYLV